MQRGIFRLSGLMVSVVVGLFVFGACGDSEPDPTPTQPSPEPTATPVVGSGIVGGDPEFDFATMVMQGYWLSRDQFGPFVMASGMGIPFEPPMDVMQMPMGMVAQNPNDPVMVPRNMAPLRAVFASASSRLLNDPREYDALDFEGLRLDPSTFVEEVTVRGQAWTMLKESQWAHNFANAGWGVRCSAEVHGDDGLDARPDAGPVCHGESPG